MTVRLGVTGSTGRMGRKVIAAANDREDCEVVLAVNRDPDGETVEGVSVEPADAFESLAAERDPSVVVDFTAPEATIDYAEHCASADVAFVTGTTGLDEHHHAALDEASAEIPVMHAPNFARGVRVLTELLGEAVENLPGYDVELIDIHHNAKPDAPSGTANEFLDTMERHGDFSGRKHGREGVDPREEGEIGVHVLRAGDAVGEHEIIIADNYEEIRLGHRAEDRSVFAAGAVDASVWIAERKAGKYEFADVIDE